MFNRSNAAPASQPRPGGAEYGAHPHAQAGYGYQPEQPAPSARPLPQGYGQQPAQSVEQQLSGLISTAAERSPEPLIEPNEVLFSRPYKAHDETVRKVKFREPTGAEYRRYGTPIRILERSDGVSVELAAVPDIGIVCSYATVLSTPPLPMSTIDTMGVQDINAISRVICGFFQ